MNPLRTIAISAAGILIASSASAACDPGKPGSELTGEEAQAVYNCIADELHAGYTSGDKRWIPAEFVTGYCQIKPA